MRRGRLEDLSMGELVEHFVAIALAQDHAMLHDENAKYRRLYHEMDSLEQELKSRPGDQRHVLVSLFNHPNAQVRLTAALATLALALEAARRTL